MAILSVNGSMDPEYFTTIFLKCDQQDHPQNTTGNYLSGTYGQTVETIALQGVEALDDKAIAVDEHERYYEGIGDDRADGSAPLPFPQSIGAQRAE